jgi:hypothetical protein
MSQFECCRAGCVEPTTHPIPRKHCPANRIVCAQQKDGYGGDDEYYSRADASCGELRWICHHRSLCLTGLMTPQRSQSPDRVPWRDGCARSRRAAGTRYGALRGSAASTPHFFAPLPISPPELPLLRHACHHVSPEFIARVASPHKLHQPDFEPLQVCLRAFSRASSR